MDDTILLAIEQALCLRLPAGYPALAAEWRLAEGDAALTELTTLYGLAEVVECNRSYEIQRYLPGYLLIGNDSGGQGVLLHADGSGDSAIYRCGLGALAPDELAVLAMSVAHWRALGWPSDGDAWYEPRYLTERLHSAAWHAQLRRHAIHGFLRQALAALEQERRDATLSLKDLLQHKRTLQWLQARAAADDQETGGDPPVPDDAGPSSPAI